jgi:hypothetical protein
MDVDPTHNQSRKPELWGYRRSVAVLYPSTSRGAHNAQAFIRCAPRMADQASWTKPLGCMRYGDSIVGEAGGGGQTGVDRPGRGAPAPSMGGGGGGRSGGPRRPARRALTATTPRAHGGTKPRRQPEPEARWSGRRGSRGVPGGGGEDRDPVQHALLADGTALDVDALAAGHLSDEGDDLGVNRRAAHQGPRGELGPVIAKRRRCDRSTVSGVTMIRACRHSTHMRDRQTQKNRSL